MISSISISIVVYKSNKDVLEKTLVSLRDALSFAQDSVVLAGVSLFIVDNEGNASINLESFVLEIFDFGSAIYVLDIISGHGNVGYGKGHNLAINRSKRDYHLVLNPDVILEKDAIFQALMFLQDYPLVGMISPASKTGHGTTEYLCKHYPCLLDLLLRGFAPVSVKRWFERRLSYYEFRQETLNGVPFVTPIISGCFMFGKVSLFGKVGGFSNDFFMYFEDFDLSLRMGKFEKIMHVPSVKITHFGGGASRKGFRHILMFVKSAIIFYRNNGVKLI